MSANRKLQTEIQQVLKKVEEGVELFDDVWEKVYAAEQQALKEKYEADLKKEIKKLQRLRDQIKTWLGSNEIKDKNPLTEARKIIETKMEQFKVCEKDTKTKAYSKEGLAREAKLDPKEAEREEKRAWTNDCLDRLNDLIDSIEADIEKVSSGGKKSKVKDQIEKFENRIKKNKWHVARLEQIMRLLINEELDPTALDAIKDDVEYYIETAQDDDGALGVDDEFDIYEELQLDVITLRSNEKEKSNSSSVDEVVDNNVNPEKLVDQQEIESESQSAKKATAVPPTVAKSTTTVKTLPSAPLVPKILSKVSSPSAPIPIAITPKIQSNSAISSNSTLAPIIPKPQISTAKLVDSNKLSNSVKVNSDLDESAKVEVVTSPWKATLTKSVSVESDSFSNNSNSSVSNNGVNSEIKATLNDELSQAQRSNTVEDINKGSVFISSNTNQSIHTSESNKKEMNDTSRMLRHSLQCIPDVVENDKISSYTPKVPCITHPSFPNQALLNSDYPILFDKLPLDTLFLAFYYQQGTLQQYLAAKRLRQQLWRFHKKYFLWFQRHEDLTPVRTSELYEEGTYVYFDENGWIQRLKQGFQLEYAYLEDEK